MITTTENSSATVQTMQMIVVSLAMGLLMFGAVVNFVFGPADPPEDEASRLMAWCVLAAGLAALVVHRVVGSMIAGQSAKDLSADDDEARRQLMVGHQTGLIISCAILEGAAFLCLIFYAFIVGEPVLLAMAGLLWMALVIKFPFATGVSAQIDHRLRRAREERSLG